MQDDRNDDDDGRMLNISQHTWDRLIGAIGRLACAMARVSDQALQSPHRVSRSDLLAMARVASELDAALDEARRVTGARTGPPVVH